MTLQDFITKWNGKTADFDGVYGAQCMDLVQLFNRDVIGAPPLAGNAIDVWGTYPQGSYWRRANTPTNVPSPGDIVIWGGPNVAVGTGPFGHIAVFIRGDASSFTSFDQNWPEGSLCHEQSHSYEAVLGWLHPQKSPVPPPPPPPPAVTPPPATAAAAVEVLSRHVAALQAHPSVGDTNALIAAIKGQWPTFTR